MISTFKFEVIKDTEKGVQFNSEGDGIGVFEAIGYLEWKIRDLIEMQKDRVKPDEVTRTRIKYEDQQ